MSTELVDCPFCEESRPIVVDYESGYQVGKRVFEVMCAFCGVTTRTFDTAAEAVAFWDTRAELGKSHRRDE